PQDRSDADAALPFEHGRRVTALDGVIELLRIGLDDDVVVGLLAVVNLWLRDLELSRNGDVLQEERGEPSRSDLVHRGHHNAVAVCELKSLVHPALCVRRQTARGKLTVAEHDLPALTVDDVPVDVDIEKVIQGANVL